MKPLSPEQLLAIADEICGVYKVRIRSFGALAACAAVPGARIHGVAVFDSPLAAGTELGEAIIKLEPLTAANDVLAKVASEVYRDWVQVG
ncbi:TetR family transcriptional regulator [Corynebacterium mayonis]|uniref:TetR family transcriptional regulator n=1 Tax=Corynebacterium mayonis TaxID=3062461 RepID=UPI0031407C67